MKASVGFIFFMLFLAGLAFVNLKGMKDQSDSVITANADLAGTAWRATHIGEMRLSDDSEIFVQFNADNSIAGNSGCNRYFGDYNVLDGALEIGLLGSTKMACPEPANSFEISFMQALGEARSVARVDSRLVMRDSKDIIVTRLVKTDSNETDD